MTEYIEFEGKNVDDALAHAGSSLGCNIEELQYDIVSHGSSGIFGLVGVKKAKIRVMADKATGRHASVQSEAKARARDIVKDAFQIEDEQENDDESPAEIQEHIKLAMDTGMTVLKKIVDAISEEARITPEVKKDRIILKVEGGNSGLLIGKRGQTLEAMQYLVEKIINKQNEERVRVLIDVEGYLDTRKSNLKKLASRMAEKARKINKPVTIGQMNAYDRRTVHLHLKENQTVRTQSVGEGYYRKLVIFPKRRRRNRSTN